MKDIIGVIGLGYVGLPLAVAFSKKYNIIGYDKNSSRVEELNSFKDSTGEVSSLKLKKAINSNRLNLITTPKIKKLHNASIFIVTVPTPIDHNKNPDLKPLIKASETIGKYISKNNLVIFESTVYPGTTEEVCVPVIERFSKLKFNEEFFVGYSPERI
ncbi:MAG: Vi polysaccharide biosynthesis UDP-N-acetylglucosamine C-6 dehydrogenase TviB, partial [Flavobacteriaceae bacterium]|nr:Vi polysaccharide biosynthesis UDP-N-acetylglucosamine C-6 dehydrogenase TviB [Flavobacteriaceae bacterium]